MLTKFKGPLTAILLSSVALVPATTVAFVAMADVAIAKSEKAGGKGNGAQKSAKGQSQFAKGNSGSKGGKGATTRRGNGSLQSLIDKVTGKDKARTAKTRVKKSSGAPKVANATPKQRPNLDPMHASNLGKMNGPMHASINAVLAHIRNGNTNGPIGAFSALAVAGYNAEGDQAVLDLKQDFLDLQAALDNSPYDSLDDYFAALDGQDPIQPIQPIEDALGALGAAQQTETDLALALEDAGYFGPDALDNYQKDVTDGVVTPVAIVETAITNYSDPSVAQADLDKALADNFYTGADPLADYQSDVDGKAPAQSDTAIDMELADLGGDAATRTAPTAIEPTDDEVADASSDLAAKTDAELAMLTHWNKNPDTDPDVISPEEQAILDKLYERLDGYQDEIGAAIADDGALPDENEVVDGDGSDCTADDADCDVDEDIAAAN